MSPDEIEPVRLLNPKNNERICLMSNFMLNVIKNYRNYKSVTCVDENGKNREYDLCDSTVIPIGLLRDIAVSETELSAAEKKYAWQVFSTYCMYLAAKKIGGEEAEEVVGYDFIQDAANCAEMCMKEENYNGFNRLFSNCLYWRRIDEQRKNLMKVKISESDAETQWQPKTVPLEILNKENGDVEIIGEVNQLLYSQSIREAQKAENVELVRDTLNACRKNNSLSQKQFDMICHKHGIGKNYELLSQTQIAKKYGVSNGYVSRTLSYAYDVLKEFMEDNSIAA